MFGTLHSYIIIKIDKRTIKINTLLKILVQFLGNDTWRFSTFGYHYPKNTSYFRKFLLENENIFENILGCDSRAYVLLIHEKKSEFENLMLLPL